HVGAVPAAPEHPLRHDRRSPPRRGACRARLLLRPRSPRRRRCGPAAPPARAARAAAGDARPRHGNGPVRVRRHALPHAGRGGDRRARRRSNRRRPRASPVASAVVPAEAAPAASLPSLAEIAADVGLRRVHMLAWRDLDDPEAGGSELHAAHIARLWAEAGIEVTMRTSSADGHPTTCTRDGYRVVRKAGRYLVFPRSAVSGFLGRDGARDAVVEIWNGMPFFSPLWARAP